MKTLSLPRPEAVLFDFDGILVDSEPMHYRAFIEVLDPLGMGFPWKEYAETYMGFDDRDAFREAFRAKGIDLDEGEQRPLAHLPRVKRVQALLVPEEHPVDGLRLHEEL